jgi:hypothetical protein
MKTRTIAGCLIGGMTGVLVGTLAYAAAFRHDGAGDATLLAVFSVLLGGAPGFVLGAGLGAGLSRLGPTKKDNNVSRPH